MIGLHRFPASVYHADPAPEPSLSSTVARVLLDQSPLHAWTAHPRLNPDYQPQSRKVFDIGRAIHRVILGKGDDYVVFPEDLLASNGAVSTKAAKEWEAEQRAQGLTPLKAEEADHILAVGEKIARELATMGIRFNPDDSEVAAMAQIDGVWCRAMVDNAPADKRRPIYDLKSCEDASPEAAIRAVENYGYDVQAAHYLETWHAATGEARGFVFVFVEKAPPYEFSVLRLAQEGDGDWMATAYSKTREARRIWRECLDANEWPGYPRRVGIIGARSFHQQKWADREIGQPITKPSAAALAAARAAQAPT